MNEEQANLAISLLEEFEAFVKKVKASGPLMGGILGEDGIPSVDCPEPQMTRLLELKSSITSIMNALE